MTIAGKYICLLSFHGNNILHVLQSSQDMKNHAVETEFQSEIECALIYECKSIHGLTDGRIEEIKTEANKRLHNELEKIKQKGDFI